MKSNLPSPLWHKRATSQTGQLHSAQHTSSSPKSSKSSHQKVTKRTSALQEEAIPQSFWDVDLEQVLKAPQGYAYEISLDVFFNARHAVVSDGTRGVIHAHSYRLAVTFRAQILSREEAFAIGYQALREKIRLVASAYNNKFLNELPPFRRIQPTTEALSAVIYQQVHHLIEGLPVELVRVTVHESPTEAVAFQKTKHLDAEMDVRTSHTEMVTFQRDS